MRIFSEIFEQIFKFVVLYRKSFWSVTFLLINESKLKKRRSIRFRKKGSYKIIDLSRSKLSIFPGIE